MQANFILPYKIYGQVAVFFFYAIKLKYGSIP